MRVRRKRYTEEFKRHAIERFEVCDNVSALADELGVERAMLYRWQKQLRSDGKLRSSGRPAGAVKSRSTAETNDLKAARDRIAELERLVGQQRLEMDFFQGALRRFEEFRRAKSKPGATASTRKSKR